MSARSLNKVLLIGNLTRDPELRYTPTGTAVCTFGLATNRSWVPSDGSERQEETEYHRIVAWSKLAEICAQILAKGRKIYVEGRIQNRKWQTQEGQERETTEIVIDNMIALGAPTKGTAGFEQVEYDVSSEVAPMNMVDSAVAEAESENDSGQSRVTEKVKKVSKVKDEVSVDDIPF